MEEEWKRIEKYPHYLISNFGKVKSLWYNKERILKYRIGIGGYLYVILCEESKRKTLKIHRLVLMTFKPISNPELFQCNHIDGIKNNNNINNLEWCTGSENVKHAFKIGLNSNKGELHPLYGKHHSEEAKKNISKGRKGKLKGRIGPMYGKHHTEETKIKMSKSRKGKRKGDNSTNHKLTEKQVKEIKILLKNKTISQREIAKMFGVAQPHISKIKSGLIWNNVKLKEDEENV